MDLERIISELTSERDRIDRALAALQAISAAKTVSARVPVLKRRHHLTAEGRKRLSEMMKKRWAERRRKVTPVRKNTKKAA
jgi:hypothetical protein